MEGLSIYKINKFKVLLKYKNVDFIKTKDKLKQVPYI